MQHVPPDVRHVTLDITGMTCAACSARIERVLAAQDGVVSAAVNLPLERADITATAALTDADLVKAVENTGFGALLRKGSDAERRAQAEALEQDRRADAQATWRLFVMSALLTLPLVLPMLAAPFGMDWMLPPLWQLALALPVQLLAGHRFYVGAYRALKGGAANMDVLVALGTTAAFLLSCFMVWSHGDHASHHVYFEASASVITLVLLGKVLEGRARQSTTEALTSLMRLRPTEARRLMDGGENLVAVNDLRIGDTIVLHPGERCPVDGIIASGESDVDESLVTGESMPVHRRSGDRMLCGSLNGSGRLEIAAIGLGEDTTLARISRMVEAAQGGKAPVQALVDQISRIFVPVVMMLALVTFAFWLLTGAEVETALLTAVAVLVIACPCALGLATPAALVAGTGAAARAGILIKDIEALERATKVDMVVFDKTGTLTEGRPVVTDILCDQAALALAASAQTASEHPLGRAIVNAAKERAVPLLPSSNFHALIGEGIKAEVDGHAVQVLSWASAQRHAATAYAGDAARLLAAGKTVVAMVIDGHVKGLVALMDAPRATAGQAIAMLKSRGIASRMLTGDAEAPALLVAEALGLAESDVSAQMRPEGKVAAIKTLIAAGHHPAMVGDGINDAPALAAAPVGIAMGSGTDAAVETAAITLLRSDPRLVPASLEIARLTRRRISQNLFWAFGYNVVGIPLAMAGWLSPSLAGAAMAASSVSVVTNSLRLKGWKNME